MRFAFRYTPQSSPLQEQSTSVTTRQYYFTYLIKISIQLKLHSPLNILANTPKRYQVSITNNNSPLQFCPRAVFVHRWVPAPSPTPARNALTRCDPLYEAWTLVTHSLLSLLCRIPGKSIVKSKIMHKF